MGMENEVEDPRERQPPPLQHVPSGSHMYTPPKKGDPQAAAAATCAREHALVQARSYYRSMQKARCQNTRCGAFPAGHVSIPSTRPTPATNVKGSHQQQHLILYIQGQQHGPLEVWCVGTQCGPPPTCPPPCGRTLVTCAQPMKAAPAAAAAAAAVYSRLEGRVGPTQAQPHHTNPSTAYATQPPSRDAPTPSRSPGAHHTPTCPLCPTAAYYTTNVAPGGRTLPQQPAYLYPYMLPHTLSCTLCRSPLSRRLALLHGLHWAPLRHSSHCTCWHLAGTLLRRRHCNWHLLNLRELSCLTQQPCRGCTWHLLAPQGPAPATCPSPAGTSLAQ
jgi:hypothetical protein